MERGDENHPVKKGELHPCISVLGPRKRSVHVFLKRLITGQTVSLCMQFIKAVFMRHPVGSTKPQRLQAVNISSLKTVVPEDMMKASII